MVRRRSREDQETFLTKVTNRLWLEFNIYHGRKFVTIDVNGARVTITHDEARKLCGSLTERLSRS